MVLAAEGKLVVAAVWAIEECLVLAIVVAAN